MKSAKGSALSRAWAGWISFHRSQANKPPRPPQRSTAKVSRALMASRVAGADQDLGRIGERAAVPAVVGMVAEVQPRPEGVEGREQDAQAMVLRTARRGRPTAAPCGARRSRPASRNSDAGPAHIRASAAGRSRPGRRATPGGRRRPPGRGGGTGDRARSRRSRRSGRSDARARPRRSRNTGCRAPPRSREGRPRPAGGRHAGNASCGRREQDPGCGPRPRRNGASTVQAMIFSGRRRRRRSICRIEKGSYPVDRSMARRGPGRARRGRRLRPAASPATMPGGGEPGTEKLPPPVDPAAVRTSLGRGARTGGVLSARKGEQRCNTCC